MIWEIVRERISGDGALILDIWYRATEVFRLYGIYSVAT